MNGVASATISSSPTVNLRGGEFRGAGCIGKFPILFKSCLRLCGEPIPRSNVLFVARTGRPRSKHKRSAQIKTTAVPADATAFDRACEVAWPNRADVLRALAAAWVAYVGEHGNRASHQFKLVPK